ncbi:hypothetical protein D7X33_26675 [Butyricicoccus sp. 1XD8-22]|nr:hypothetical protein D7X33_26675 [Butyricicoccus sp. 1XD8-22]
MMMNEEKTLYNMYLMLNNMQSQLNECKSYLEEIMNDKGYDYSTILEDYDVVKYDERELFNEN